MRLFERRLNEIFYLVWSIDAYDVRDITWEYDRWN